MMLFVNLFTYFFSHKRIKHYKLYYYNSRKLFICFLGTLFEVVEAVKEKIDYMQQNTITLSMMGGMEINCCIQNVLLGDVINRTLNV